ncbi:hypothetical protein [Marinifilum sp. D737]|uniref:hypothetical protein n=1 Tax=Marinifilum sp. D737 TaxID=2969628 RepID=UPI002276B445|nr:hypothetical protein [Marinifilum sp. D737]MCY1636251.1 hypothetical protein [Marinifilum sp. D737]
MEYKLILALISPILITIGGLLTWFLKTRNENLQAVEERAREKRLETYKKLLDPFIVLLTPTKTKKEEEKAVNSITTVDYKRAAFDLVIYGSDEMVHSYNKMMQYFFRTNFEKQSKEDSIRSLKYFAEFILAIRKDLNNKHTKLRRSETLEFTTTDIESYRNLLD